MFCFCFCFVFAARREKVLYSIQHHPLKTNLFAVGGTNSSARVYDQRFMAFGKNKSTELLPLTTTKYGTSQVPKSAHISCTIQKAFK